MTRAPGRLDVMGGIGDYSGCLVLQKPTAEACHVACQHHPLDKQVLWKHIQNRHKGHCESPGSLSFPWPLMLALPVCGWPTASLAGCLCLSVCWSLYLVMPLFFLAFFLSFFCCCLLLLESYRLLHSFCVNTAGSYQNPISFHTVPCEHLCAKGSLSAAIISLVSLPHCGM